MTEQQIWQKNNFLKSPKDNEKIANENQVEQSEEIATIGQNLKQKFKQEFCTVILTKTTSDLLNNKYQPEIEITCTLFSQVLLELELHLQKGEIDLDTLIGYIYLIKTAKKQNIQDQKLDLLENLLTIICHQNSEKFYTYDDMLYMSNLVTNHRKCDSDYTKNNLNFNQKAELINFFKFCINLFENNLPVESKNFLKEIFKDSRIQFALQSLSDNCITFLNFIEKEEYFSLDNFSYLLSILSSLEIEDGIFDEKPQNQDWIDTDVLDDNLIPFAFSDYISSSVNEPNLFNTQLFEDYLELKNKEKKLINDYLDKRNNFLNAVKYFLNKEKTTENESKPVVRNFVSTYQVEELLKEIQSQNFEQNYQMEEEKLQEIKK